MNIRDILMLCVFITGLIALFVGVRINNALVWLCAAFAIGWCIGYAYTRLEGDE